MLVCGTPADPVRVAQRAGERLFYEQPAHAARSERRRTGATVASEVICVRPISGAPCDRSAVQPAPDDTRRVRLFGEERPPPRPRRDPVEVGQSSSAPVGNRSSAPAQSVVQILAVDHDPQEGQKSVLRSPFVQVGLRGGQVVEQGARHFRQALLDQAAL